MIPLNELKSLNDKELETELKKADLDLLKLRLAVSSRQSKETTKLTALRKYVARIKTLKRIMKKERPVENPQSAIIK